MTSTHRPSGIRKFASGLAVALLAAGGVAIVAAPAHADPEGIETTISITADPDVPGSAVLHAEMVGPYIDAAGAIPAGTWSFLVADNESGAALFAQDVAQPAGGPTTAEVVWTDVPAGVEASGIVMYVPSESAEQFVFAGSSVAFASEGTPAEEAKLYQAEAPPTAVEDVSDPFPLWLGLLVTVAGLLLAAAVIVLLRRRNRPSIIEPSPEP